MNSPEPSGVSPDAFAVLGQGGVVFVAEGTGCLEDLKVFVEFGPCLGRGEGDGHGGVLEDELIPGRGAGDREPGRVVGGRPQEHPPAKGGVRDHGHAERPRLYPSPDPSPDRGCPGALGGRGRGGDG